MSYATLGFNEIFRTPLDSIAFAHLAQAVMADAELTAALAGADGDADAFVALLAQQAAARGLHMPQVAGAANAQDRLGLARTMPPALSGVAWPPPQWLPYQVAAEDRIYVDWIYFGPQPLTEPFFEGALRRALLNRFARMFRYRMTLDDFLRGAADAPSLQPDGLIFHMSRCGSTLASQMLAALPDSIVISEAAPLDAIVQLARLWSNLPAEQHAVMLRAMVAAYGRRRAGGERRYVLKLDSWHALALPLFRRALPDVPWTFLYREPVEVLVSQVRQTGTQMVPGVVPPSLYGLSEADTLPPEQYYARVLAKICDAALAHAGDGGLLINYSELPDAVSTRLMPHFGITQDDGEAEAMRLAARRDAKSPYRDFTHDSQDKQHEADAALREICERHLGAVYRALEAARRAA